MQFDDQHQGEMMESLGIIEVVLLPGWYPTLPPAHPLPSLYNISADFNQLKSAHQSIFLRASLTSCLNYPSEKIEKEKLQM